MFKSTLSKALFFTALSINALAGGIEGFWETLDQKTNKPSSIIAIYPYQGKFYGRIIGTYNAQGVIDNTLDHPKTKAPGIKGNPPYCGLDILWAAAPEGDHMYKGQIVDPEKGKIYTAEVWREGADVILKGEIAFFGSKRTWPPFPESKFTGDFKKPDVSSFVPKKPDITD